MTSCFVMDMKNYLRMNAELVLFLKILLLTGKNRWEILGIKLFIDARNLLLICIFSIGRYIALNKLCGKTRKRMGGSWLHT